MAYSSVDRSSDLSLLELLQHSADVLLKREARRSLKPSSELINAPDRVFFSETGIVLASEAFHAAPLSPLKARDLRALDDLFADGEMRLMEEDILHNLLRRCPEPCWEDTLLEFL